MKWFNKSVRIPSREEALAGRDEVMTIDPVHWVNQRSMTGPFEPHLRQVTLAMGCFWGAERRLWQLPGVWVTAVGYAGGYTPNPTYQEVCSGMTAHTEVVLVVYDPNEISLEQILSCFWQSHDPTQGLRQGNDTGSQYRSAIYVESEEDLIKARQSLQAYQEKLQAAGFGEITTELKSGQTFYFAEQYHQQYLAKNPNGYCGLKGTGVSC